VERSTNKRGREGLIVHGKHTGALEEKGRKGKEGWVGKRVVYWCKRATTGEKEANT